MTREEAIEVLRGLYDGSEAILMAIEALKREPSDDLISRAEAIDAIKPILRDILNGNAYKAICIPHKLTALPSADRPRGDFDGMIFSTDKYMAFIDKKEIHIMRKDTHKVTIERTFNTEEDEYKPMPKHDRDWIVGCIKHDGFIKTDRGDEANQIILDALSADRPTGKWINEDGTYYANCSKCGYQMDTHVERGYFRFCPNCGADMRSE